MRIVQLGGGESTNISSSVPYRTFLQNADIMHIVQLGRGGGEGRRHVIIQ